MHRYSIVSIPCAGQNQMDPTTWTGSRTSCLDCGKVNDCSVPARNRKKAQEHFLAFQGKECVKKDSYEDALKNAHPLRFSE